MELLISCVTDVGTIRPNNQDSFSAKVMSIKGAEAALLVLCDGMGGYEKGEVASASVVGSFDDWFENRFPSLYENGIRDDVIRNEWTGLINNANEGIKDFATKEGLKMGTTVVAVLILKNRFYEVNVGDSRAYHVGDTVKQISKDHSLVAREVELGNITEVEAETDTRKNVLLQCIGASSCVKPDFQFGTLEGAHSFVLCSDGFWHFTSLQEIQNNLSPNLFTTEEEMEATLKQMVEIVKARGETDNITVAAGVVKTDFLGEETLTL